MSGASFCEALADWAASAAPLPAPARAEARLALLDTLGCILAGWDEPQTRAARSAFGESAATGRALIFGTAAHALDFDDYELPGSTHPSAPVYGALLALSVGRDLTWATLLDAYATGYEAIVRLGEAMGYEHYAAGWHSTGTLGTVGAAAASARLLGLGREGIAHAVALGASMGAGLKAQFGTDAKALHAGLAARAGAEAALLAAAGARANLDAFEGRYGFRAVHHGAPGLDAGLVLAKIGRPPGLVEHPILRKPWPSCAYTHRAIAAALALRPALPDGGLAACRVSVRLPEPFFRVAGFLHPGTPNEARFSVTYCVAAALLDGRVGPETFRPETIARPGIAALIGRIAADPYDPGPEVTDMSPEHPDTVTVALAGGPVLAETVAHVPGGAGRPMTEGELRRKFRDCGGGEATARAILSAADGAPVRVGLAAAGPEIA